MIDLLSDKVTPNLKNYKRSSVRNFLLFTLCLIRKRTVCINKLKGSVGAILGNTNTDVDSHYKRLIRLFSDYGFSRLWIDLLGYAFTLLRLKTQYAVLDGTSWKTGKKWRHYLTLGIVYKGVCIPILWVNLKQSGISSQTQRIKLFKRAKRFFNLTGKILLADREYNGMKFFNFLIDSGLDFVIRLKRRNYKELVDASPGLSYDQLIDKVKRSGKANKTVRKAFVLNGKRVFIVISKNPNQGAKEAYMILLTTLDESGYKTVQRYGVRWTIEHCFKHLKSNGFDLECMNLHCDARCNLLLAFVVFAYVLSIIEGLKTYARVGVVQYAEGRQERRVSLFRYGIDRLENLCVDFYRFIAHLVDQWRFATSAYRSAKLLNVQ